MTADAAIADLFGRDPVAAEQAVTRLAEAGPSAIGSVLPLELARSFSDPAAAQRAARLAQCWGESIVPHLERCIRQGNRHVRTAAPAFFGGLHGSQQAAQALVGVLADAGDFDAERSAIQALGWLGADGYAWNVDRHVRFGQWTYETSWLDGKADQVSLYEYDKLWSAGVEALVRMLAHATDSRHDIPRLLGLLGDALLRQAKELPGASLSGAAIVAGLAHLFSGRHIDPLIRGWGQHASLTLRCLHLDILAAIAPVRVTDHLIALATQTANPPQLRHCASGALAEIRHRDASRKLADCLAGAGHDDDEALSALGWAASTLYVAGGERGDNAAFYDALADDPGEAGAQYRFALAVRGDHSASDRLVDLLDHADAHQRRPAALALARLNGPAALPMLRARLHDAGDELERSVLLAACIHAGETAHADALHAALQGVNSLQQLRSIWRQEIVGAFRRLPDDLRYDAWCRQALIGESLRTAYAQWGGAVPTPGGAVSAPAVAPVAGQGPPRVFISYSHRDKAWLTRFQDMQKPLERAGRLALWDDTRMQPGLWEAQITQAMAQAETALFLVSAEFLASDFVARKELPVLLERARAQGLRIVWVLLNECFWEATPLAAQDCVNADRPLAGLRTVQRQTIIKKAWLSVLGDAG